MKKPQHLNISDVYTAIIADGITVYVYEHQPDKKEIFAKNFGEKLVCKTGEMETGKN